MGGGSIPPFLLKGISVRRSRREGWLQTSLPLDRTLPFAIPIIPAGPPVVGGGVEGFICGPGGVRAHKPHQPVRPQPIPPAILRPLLQQRLRGVVPPQPSDHAAVIKSSAVSLTFGGRKSSLFFLVSQKNRGSAFSLRLLKVTELRVDYREDDRLPP